MDVIYGLKGNPDVTATEKIILMIHSRERGRGGVRREGRERGNGERERERERERE